MHTLFVFTAAISFASSTFALPTTTPTCDATTAPERLEWRQLSSTQKADFINAVKCLSNPATHPHSSSLSPTGYTAGIAAVDTTSSRYDDFVYAHMDTNIKDHFTGLFLPWHRWYLTAFEKALRNDCGYSGYLPYWDWSLGKSDNPLKPDAANVAASPVFSADPTTGLGTFGAEANGYTVTDGAFASVNRSYPQDHVIARNMNNSSPTQPFMNKIFPFDFQDPTKTASSAFTPAEVQHIITHFPGDYFHFAYYMDGVSAQGMHNAAHLQFLPGDMSNPSYSPNDVIFFMHHANLDRIWYEWQGQSTANANAFEGGSVQDLNEYDDFPLGKAPALDTTSTIWTAGLETTNPTVADVMSTTGGYLCFKYSTFGTRAPSS
ncbi:hypothetical protein FRC07_001630 [Ceratobasidium sp. 392]|nr:hypothetical protein FRC07_001630 [Ceratobasidium sp. 392]